MMGKLGKWVFSVLRCLKAIYSQEDHIHNVNEEKAHIPIALARYHGVKWSYYPFTVITTLGSTMRCLRIYDSSISLEALRCQLMHHSRLPSEKLLQLQCTLK